MKAIKIVKTRALGSLISIQSFSFFSRQNFNGSWSLWSLWSLEGRQAGRREKLRDEARLMTNSIYICLVSLADCKSSSYVLLSQSVVCWLVVGEGVATTGPGLENYASHLHLGFKDKRPSEIG